MHFARSKTSTSFTPWDSTLSGSAEKSMNCCTRSGPTYITDSFTDARNALKAKRGQNVLISPHVSDFKAPAWWWCPTSQLDWSLSYTTCAESSGPRPGTSSNRRALRLPVDKRGFNHMKVALLRRHAFQNLVTDCSSSSSFTPFIYMSLVVLILMQLSGSVRDESSATAAERRSPDVFPKTAKTAR